MYASELKQTSGDGDRNLDGQVARARRFVRSQLGQGSREADPTLLDDVGAVGDRPGKVPVLLREKNRDARGLELAHHPRELLCDQRRETLRGLVEQDAQGIAHQAARDREHLLLAAGYSPCGPVLRVREIRE